MKEPEHTNLLINEKSPYLLQHAHNPIDWHPWGKEAFERAKRQDMPIFLSIGYATCHWCHMMAKEAFSDEEVAKVLNDVFVCIKVDREEFPEVDGLYMELAQALMSAAGGWPLNVILTPDLKPFFAVTYLPSRSKNGLIGIIEFAKQIQMLWMSEERGLIVEQANKVVELFRESSPTKGEELPTSDILDLAVEELFEVVDPVYGGIKGEPKFPISYACDFLMNISNAKGDSRSLFYVELTLGRMHRGGLYDHVGGGFSRYSIDAAWRIPHFEKTLIDNAILARTYLLAWKLTQKGFYRDVCVETLDYLLSHLLCPEGGFYTAEDADFEGKEGLYYTWTASEIDAVLEPEEMEIFCAYFGVTTPGNFEGRNVLHVSMPLIEFSEALSLPPVEVQKILDGAIAKLKKIRNERPRPFIDDKVIVSGNGFAIEAFALAGRAFDEPHYTEIAVKGMAFVKKHLWKEGRLLRRFRDGDAAVHAGMDDYSALIKGCLTLFEMGQGTEHLLFAIELTDLVRREFKEKNGAFFQTDDEEEIIIRKCEFYDGAEPSSNGVHAENLVRLYQVTGDEKYLRQAEDIFKAVGEFVEVFPPGSCYHLLALQRYFDKKATTCVIALNKEQTYEKELASALGVHFSPNTAVVWKRFGDEMIDKLLAVHADKIPIDGQTMLYVCTQERCEPPLQIKEEMLERIKKL